MKKTMKEVIGMGFEFYKPFPVVCKECGKFISFPILYTGMNNFCSYCLKPDTLESIEITDWEAFWNKIVEETIKEN